MSKAEQKKIKEMRDLILRLECETVDWKLRCYDYENTTKSHKEEIQREKEKYAQLLEKYISMMERMQRIDEQRETD